MHNPISWHIEPTSRCTLACPGCDRTWYQKTFKHQLIQDIDVDALLNFLEKNNFLQSKISLCGNTGDSIYHPNFLYLVKELKIQKHTISLHTNGSAKTKPFWNDLCQLLTADDKIVFAIDGLEDTNHIYRKNSNWQQVMQAVDVVTKSQVKSVWQFIIFKHNQHQIKIAEKLSKKLNFDRFEAMKSHRWLDDALTDYMPNNEYLDQKYFDQQNILKNNHKQKMHPKCMTNTAIYINAKGNIFPCCESATHRFQKKHVFGKKYINIKDDLFEIQSEHKVFLDRTKNWSTAPLVCRLHCSK